MDITVVLCTYNRSEALASALKSAAALALPESVEWEVLVVDNNSNDQTCEVVTDFCKRHPNRFRYLFEPRQGKSLALNAGIRHANGEILAFMDDDVRVEPNWLQNLTAALHNGEWAGAGGRIIPAWTCSPPPWLSLRSRYAMAPLVAFDLGSDACELRESPFGTNMAYRKEMFEKYGGFRTDLGPRPGNEYGKSEDAEFGDRLLSAGERLRYEPAAIVYHPVPDNRMEKDYFLTWWFHKGAANIRQYGIRRGTKYFIAGIPLYLFRNLAMCTLRWMAAFQPSRRFSNKINVWIKVGEILECYRQAVDARKRPENCSA